MPVSPTARLGRWYACSEAGRKPAGTAPPPGTPPGSSSCLPVANSQPPGRWLCSAKELEGTDDRQTDRQTTEQRERGALNSKNCFFVNTPFAYWGLGIQSVRGLRVGIGGGEGVEFYFSRQLRKRTICI